MESFSDNDVNELKQLYDQFRIQTKIPLKPDTANLGPILNSGDSHKKDEALIENKFAPFFSKLDDMVANTEKDSQNYLRFLAMKASLYYEISKLLLNIDRIEESKEILEKGLDLIKQYEEEPLIAFLYMRLVNYLSYVLSILCDFGRARALLETNIRKDVNSVSIVYTTEEFFFKKTVQGINAKSKVNRIIINNMQMLGWIYGKLGLNELYADIIHKSLQRELDSKEGDPIQWAVRCYRLASLFITQNKWKNATYHLTAAQFLLDPMEAQATPNNLLFKTQADMARIWVSEEFFSEWLSCKAWEYLLNG